jgi:hypothetical protein
MVMNLWVPYNVGNFLTKLHNNSHKDSQSVGCVESHVQCV